MEQWTGTKLGKEYVKAIYCDPAYLTYMLSTSWEMLGWMKHKLESRLPGEISITSDDTTIMTENKEELKSFLMQMKVQSEKAVLKLNIKKMKIMANRWGKQWKQWQTLFYLAPKSLQMVTVVMKIKDTCSLEEKLWVT